MAILLNIRTVAKYEATILRRSWFFRLFSIGALFIFTILNIGFFSPIGDEPWGFISIPSSVPLFNLYILNIGQAVVVIFLAADFLKRDKKVDTNEVLYTRSMSNFEYIMGKTWGILRLFLGLDVIILLIALIVNIISNKMTVDLLSYLYYLLLICVPTILFSLGLAFMLMSLIRNQAITFLILLGIAALDIFWLYFRFSSIFDYMAFGLPLYKSHIIGFDNLDFILNQRLIYFFLGLSFVFVTVLLFKRLPQSRALTILSYILLLIFLAGSAFCAFNVYSSYKKDTDERSLVIETNRQFENRNFVSLTDAEIALVHKGSSIEAIATLEFINENNESLDKYLFSLNPGLKVTAVTSGGKNLSFTNTNHIIEIDPLRILLPGEEDSLSILYSGIIQESFCYPDYIENIKENPYQIQMLNVHKRQAFLSDKYVLLIPETHWYPVPGLNYYPSNPARIKVDFTNYTLKVKPEEGLTAVSQGIMNSSGGYSVFTPESPLTGLTLAIGDYRSDTLKLDTIKYVSHYFPGNDYYKKDLAEIKDTLPLLVKGIMRDLEVNFSTRYPFKTLSLLEVPVQFFSLPRMSTQTRAEVQPSMVLLPEKLSTTQGAGFKRRFTRNKKRMERENQVITDKELQVRIFNDFIRATFISGENFTYRNGIVINEPTRYRLGPSFYFYKNNFFSTEYPVINAVFESHLQKVKVPGEGDYGFRSYLGTLSDVDRTNLIFRAGSFRELLAMNPSVDTIRLIITMKGDYLFNMLRSKAGITDFNDYFRKYVEDHKFRRIDIKKFNEDINAKFGFEFYPYLDDWFNSKDQPGFLFTDLQVNEIVVDERVRYKVTFVASNPESVAGIFNISFRTGGQGSGSRQTSINVQQGVSGTYSFSEQGRGMDVTDISRIVMLGPAEAKKVSIILDYEPREMLVNTLFAKNIPGEINTPVNEIKKSKNRNGVTEGEELLESIPKLALPGETIVDNEDPGFDRGQILFQGPLKKMLKIESTSGDIYQQVRRYNRPNYWQSVVNSYYYGKYVLSSVYTAGGTGDRSVKWMTPIDEAGYYDIYCYIGKVTERVTVTSGGNAPPPPQEEFRQESLYKDMHYKIYHDEGVEEITVDFENSDAGWHNMGRYYLTPDSAKVELTNQSSGRLVIGDAIKWVRAK
jgi:ABC-type transport system involved in multi-copper enzyme maturation permease subunit